MVVRRLTCNLLNQNVFGLTGHSLRHMCVRVLESDTSAAGQ